MSIASLLFRRSALLVAAISAVWLIALLWTGGFTLRLGAVTFRSHRPAGALAVFGIAALIAFTAGGRLAVAADLSRSWIALDRAAAGVAAAAAIAAFSIAVHWGTFTAGGSDSYCYVSQAALFADGRMAIDQPLARELPWTGAAASLVPSGYVASPDPAVIVPKCPPGLALLMAVALRIGGTNAVFYVVPLLGGLAVFLTFAIGRLVEQSVAGALAAVLLSVSPIFVFQIVQPMSDVPATAFWLLAIAFALRRTAAAATIAGLAASAAILTRPNLAPLAGVMLLFRIPNAQFRIVPFLLGALPGLVATLALNAALHGSPFRSGYGDLGQLFAVGNTLSNITHFARSLLETQTPIVLVGLAAPFLAVRTAAPGKGPASVWWLFLMFIAAVWAAYVGYQAFGEWWYVRFLLPALPLMLLSSAVCIVYFVERLPPATRTPVLVIGVALLCGWTLRVADARLAFDLHRLERRYAVTGAFIARQLPPNAIVLAVHQSGSVRHYSGRTTIAWDAIDPGELDAAVDALARRKREPYLLLETWEESVFRQRFRGRSRLGDLDWPPAAIIGRDVRLYEIAARTRYRLGRPVHPSRVPVP